jgi:carboxyl-terminal processing protease
MTIAQFFRVNGGTTQLRGVTPDISLAGLSDPKSFGEASYDNALPWTQIKACEICACRHSLMRLCCRNCKAAMMPGAERSGVPTLFRRYCRTEGAARKRGISLNEAERRKELTAREDRLKAREKIG